MSVMVDLLPCSMGASRGSTAVAASGGSGRQLQVLVVAFVDPSLAHWKVVMVV